MSKEKSTKLVIFNKIQLINNGYVDLMGFFGTLPGFFGQYQYDFMETGVSEKGTDVGAEIKSSWEATREVTDYVKFKIKILILARDIKKVKSEDGQDIYWSRLWIYIDVEMIKNWNDTFGSGHWQEMMRQIYERYLIADSMDAYKAKLYYEALEMIDRMKANFQ
jgi:hypothetical protein